jgi:hypothetical protein
MSSAFDIFDTAPSKSSSSSSKGGSNAFDIFDAPKEQPGLAKRVAQAAISSPVGQAALGTAKRYTFPADIFKALTTAEAQDTFRQLQSENPELITEEGMAQIQRLAEFLPTQQSAEKAIGNAAGLDFSPQGGLGSLSRTAGELASLQPGSLLTKPLQRAGAGFAGAGTEKALEHAGVNPLVSSLAGAAVTGGLTVGAGQKALKSPAALEAREVAEKHGLRKFAGLERETPVKGRPLAKESAVSTAQKELEDTTLAALEKSVSKGSEAKRLYEIGTDIRSAAKDAYTIARDSAKRDPRALNVEPIRDWATEEIASIKRSAPSPSHAEQAAIKILSDEQRSLAQGLPTTEALLKQYANYNSNLKPLYRKAEWTGAEAEVARTYEGLKKQIGDVLEKQADPAVSDAFRTGNHLFHEQKKLEAIEAALGKSEDKAIDYSSFQKALNSPRKRRILKESLGDEAYKELGEIARYGKSAEERVLGKISVMKQAPSLIGELNVLGKLALGVPLGAAKAIFGKGGVKLINRVRGRMLLRDSTRKDYLGLLKATASGKDAAIRRAADKLNKSFDSQFGSLEEMVNVIDEGEAD